MAGLKPSVNLFALLDSNDPGDKLVTDLDDAHAKQDAPAAKHKKTATPAASLTKDLFAQAYPTARDYIIRKNQLERQACARARAEAGARAKANNGVSGDDRSPGASADSSKVQDGRFEVPKRQQRNMSRYPYQAAPAEVVEAPPAPQQAAPPSPPSIDDINEFPSLK
ncbi:hypothetical protein CFC21_105525 [Triticum aestivum]|uniref:Uncharacterized protein n=2 Tax=Triticum aestivum TaxID=4565 RepID=A0A9R1N8N3_WHEAT|nr:hypothetical protein CFC21_105525 [Triticum aestivum]